MAGIEHTCPQCGAALPKDSPPGVCPKCLMQLGFQSEQEGHADAQPAPTHASQDGHNTLTGDQLQPWFPELEIVSQLGHGGMGVVFKARQKHLDRLVALKVLRPDIGKDPAFAERFTREARALARLNHSAIVSVHDFGQKGDLYYFIMEYVDGTSLRGVERTKHLTPEQALAIVPRICEALQFAHDEGVVHRDIKPENILIDTRGRVKIADFGLAKLMRTDSDDFTLTGTRQVMGTPHYMAPEQMERPREVDHRADIYSLGVVIYEMLTGELPLGRFSPPSEKVHVDVRLDEVVLRALEKEPERRYQKATDVQTEVEEIAAHPAGQSYSAGALNVSRVLASIKLPAFGLLLAGAIDCLVAAFLCPFALFEEPEMLPFALLQLLGIPVAIGAWHMLKTQSYGWTVGAVIAALVPCHIGFVIGLPFGIWALVLLSRPEVKRLFGRDASQPTNEVGDRVTDLERVIEGRLTALESVLSRGVERVSAILGPTLSRLWEIVIRIVTLPARISWKRLCAWAAAFAIWTVLCCGVAAYLAYRSHTIIPSKYLINDQTAAAMTPRSGAYATIGVRASGYGPTKGIDPPIRDFRRDNITFSITPNDGRSSRSLRIVLRELQPIASFDPWTKERFWPAFEGEQTVLQWMKGIGIDTTRSEVQAEAQNLTQIVNELQTEGGFTYSPRPAVRDLSSMFDSQLFELGQRGRLHLSSYVQDKVIIAFVAAVAVEILLGYVAMICFAVSRSRRRRRADTAAV